MFSNSFKVFKFALNLNIKIMKTLLLLFSTILMSFNSFSDEPFKTIEKHVIFEIDHLDRTPIFISIIDDENRLVYQEVLIDKTEVHKNFNFENAYPGLYTIEIKHGTTTYTNVIKI